MATIFVLQRHRLGSAAVVVGERNKSLPCQVNESNRPKKDRIIVKINIGALSNNLIKRYTCIPLHVLLPAQFLLAQI
jgi:hypothetical protein